jgi:hypothetical protein
VRGVCISRTGGAANTADAARLRKMATGLASDTMSKMYIPRREKRAQSS